jgi:hypothetical protein
MCQFCNKQAGEMPREVISWKTLSEQVDFLACFLVFLELPVTSPLTNLCWIFFKANHKSQTICTKKCNLCVMLTQEGDAEIAAKMQDLALGEGALPKHLHSAMFTQSNDSRMLTNR